MFAHVARHGSGINIEAAARTAADDDTNDLPRKIFSDDRMRCHQRKTRAPTTSAFHRHTSELADYVGIQSCQSFVAALVSDPSGIGLVGRISFVEE
jgi:hypothetical protein